MATAPVVEPPPAVEPPAPPPQPAQAPSAPPTAGEPDAAAVRTMWTTVREKVRQRSRTTEVMLSGATVRAVEENTLVLMHESAPLAKRLSEQRNSDVIRDALKDALGVDWRVRCEPGLASASPTEPTASAPPVRQQKVAEEAAEEESMLAQAAEVDSAAVPRRDPEEVALELLQSELGARKIDG